MINISTYQGLGVFGPAYKIMLENDAHASGSIDRILVESMIRLCSETVDFLYNEYAPTRSFYKKGTRTELEQYVEMTILDNHSEEERIAAIARFTGSLQESACEDLKLMQIGGTEEEIIVRGSGWCSDVARVGCALCQVAGFAARLVSLFDTEKAYSGHVIIEVCRAKIWGAVDPLTNVVYRHPGGKPASTWDLMNNPHLIECHSRGESTPYTVVSQFRGAAISNYFVWRWREYDYTVSKINDYYRSILEMSNKGWPGGLRWLHGEDR
ncbi:MAG: hypothetical protein CVV02_18535 [Firmicutes bacterium HGW-Firmicutes-7]|nr:MAG: hypothetical protein CVV02_18535 [Firmicutes bacterium HGW-Firmicutes-7]